MRQRLQRDIDVEILAVQCSYIIMHFNDHEWQATPCDRRRVKYDWKARNLLLTSKHRKNNILGVAKLWLSKLGVCLKVWTNDCGGEGYNGWNDFVGRMG